MLSRRAASLVEMLVSLMLAGIVFAAATSSTLRQQRAHARIAGVMSSDVQLRAGTNVLTSQLAFLNAAAGDLAPGEAQDTAVQLRGTIAVALACDNAVGLVNFLPDPPGAVALTGVASQPRVGDSLWILRDSAWSGARIASVDLANATCPPPFSATGSTFRMTLSGFADTIPAGTPLRITRPIRYAFYRSGDGTWQLGFREWSETPGAFSAPQPVAGPFLRASADRRSRFRYFRATGDELLGAGIESAVSLVRVMLYSRNVAREVGQDSVRTDSIDVALQRSSSR
jgi:hypothetical protein